MSSTPVLEEHPRTMPFRSAIVDDSGMKPYSSRSRCLDTLCIKHLSCSRFQETLGLILTRVGMSNWLL